VAATLLAQATLPLAGRARWDPTEEAPPLPAGTVIDGRYRVIGLLGEGGMGRVYEAQHLFIGRKLALKLVRRDAGTGEGATRVIQEALVAGKVPHATVVPVYDCAALPDGQVYVAMELLRGESLEQALRRPQPAAAVLRWLAEVARGLAAAHRAGIVHRDVKPANLFLAVDAAGAVQPRILDFGIAKLLPGLSGEAAAVQTQAGALLGTPYYMAPERGRGDAGGPASDLYSLGVILYEAITGELPFVGENFMEVVGRHLREAPLDPRQAAPERAIPDSLAELVLGLLKKEVAARADDGEAVARALVEIAGREEIAGLVAGPRGAEAAAVGAEAATQSLVEAATRRLAEDVLADRSTQRLDEDGAGDRPGVVGSTQGHALGDSSGRSGDVLRDSGVGRSGARDVLRDSGAGAVRGDSAGRSGALAVPEDSMSRGHGPRDSAGRSDAARTVWLALAFAAAAGLGGWAAWQWSGPPTAAVDEASQPNAAAGGERLPSAAAGDGRAVRGPDETGSRAAVGEGSTATDDVSPGSGSTSPRAAGGEGSTAGDASPGETGSTRAADAGAGEEPRATAPTASKKRTSGKRTEGKKAGTTGAGKDDRPKLKTDVYDD
jgi:serine/threonine-protein kinase